jgi:hypothetical protein
MINWAVSFLYALGRFTLGLLLHPYQTMQMIVEHKLFVWLTVIPTLFLALLTLFWKLIVWFSTPLLTISTPPFLIDSYTFFTTWIVVFCFYWQLMLFYLLIRFRTFERTGIKENE